MALYVWGCKDFVPSEGADVPPSRVLPLHYAKGHNQVLIIGLNAQNQADTLAMACGSTHSIIVTGPHTIMSLGDGSVGQFAESIII